MIFVYDPAQRITAKQALQHRWLKEATEPDIGTKLRQALIQCEEEWRAAKSFIELVSLYRRFLEPGIDIPGTLFWSSTEEDDLRIPGLVLLLQFGLYIYASSGYHHLVDEYNSETCSRPYVIFFVQDSDCSRQLFNKLKGNPEVIVAGQEINVADQDNPVRVLKGSKRDQFLMTAVCRKYSIDDSKACEDWRPTKVYLTDIEWSGVFWELEATKEPILVFYVAAMEWKDLELSAIIVDAAIECRLPSYCWDKREKKYYASKHD
jgi:hypothetical protein